MTKNPKTQLPWSHPFRVTDLNARRPTPFDLKPNKPAVQSIAADLGLLGLQKLRFSGQIRPSGSDGWHITARLGATVVQPCIATLDPVLSRIDTEIERMFLPDQAEYEDGSENEMPGDERIDPLGNTVDIGEIMVESLILNLPLYPRSQGAGSGDATFAGPGITPMTDDDARPFANLKSLRDKLEDNQG